MVSDPESSEFDGVSCYGSTGFYSIFWLGPEGR